MNDELRALILENPSRLANLLGFDNNWHQIEWYYLLSDPIIRRIVLLAPREHSKSTCFSVIYPLWEILRNRNVRIVIVSNTASQAESFLRQNVSIIENNPELRSIFGELKPKIPEKWTDREIIVNRDTTEKDATISTTGTGGPILSKRADIIICDDILNKENTRTYEQRKKVKEWFNDVLTPVVVKGGKIIWVATAFNPDDLSHDLLKNPMYDVQKIYKAIISEPDQTLWDQYKDLLLNHDKKKADKFYFTNRVKMNEGAKVIWPERYSYKDLFDKKIEIGVRSFSLMYQNEAVSDETAVIREEWIEKCKDTSRSLMDKLTPSVNSPVVVQGVDLAISEKSSADWNVIVTLAKTADNKILLVNGLKGHWSPSEIRENIVGQYERFNPKLIYVEDNAFQASLVKDMQDATTLPIKGFTTSGEKFDEFLGVNSIAVALENGQFILPANPQDIRTIDFYNELKEEMMKFPSGHTGDALMALYFAFVALRTISNKQNSVAVSVSGLYSGIKI